MMNIGNQIQRLRKHNNITQEMLSAEMGVSTAAVSKWENGNSMPDIVMLCALADFFKVTTDELLGRDRADDVIICDDAEVVREALCCILQKEGYRNITLTENGEQFWTEISKKTPDLVLLDINLPDTCGLELLDKVKKQHPASKVIMVTADSSESTKNMAIKSGADAYVTKPFLPEHIKLAIDKIKALN